MQTTRTVTSISVPEDKVEIFNTVKQIIDEKHDSRSMSSLFLEFLEKIYREETSSASLAYFAPKVTVDNKTKQTYLKAIVDSDTLFEEFGAHLEQWVRHYNATESGRELSI